MSIDAAQWSQGRKLLKAYLEDPLSDKQHLRSWPAWIDEHATEIMDEIERLRKELKERDAQSERLETAVEETFCLCGSNEFSRGRCVYCGGLGSAD